MQRSLAELSRRQRPIHPNPSTASKYATHKCPRPPIRFRSRLSPRLRAEPFHVISEVIRGAGLVAGAARQSEQHWALRRRAPCPRGLRSGRTLLLFHRESARLGRCRPCRRRRGGGHRRRRTGSGHHTVRCIGRQYSDLGPDRLGRGEVRDGRRRRRAGDEAAHATAVAARSRHAASAHRRGQQPRGAGRTRVGGATQGQGGVRRAAGGGARGGGGGGARGGCGQRKKRRRGRLARRRALALSFVVRVRGSVSFVARVRGSVSFVVRVRGSVSFVVRVRGSVSFVVRVRGSVSFVVRVRGSVSFVCPLASLACIVRLLVIFMHSLHLLHPLHLLLRWYRVRSRAFPCARHVTRHASRRFLDTRDAPMAVEPVGRCGEAAQY